MRPQRDGPADRKPIGPLLRFYLGEAAPDGDQAVGTLLCEVGISRGLTPNSYVMPPGDWMGLPYFLRLIRRSTYAGRVGPTDE